LNKQIDVLDRKLKRLEALIVTYKKVIVAFSGGVDSTFLTHVAVSVLGRKNVLAVLAVSKTYPKREYMSALRFLKNSHIKYLIIRTDELNDPAFLKNPVERCYYCKRELFSSMLKIASNRKIGYVLDGSNLDDRKDMRFGAEARREFDVLSPLDRSGMTKQDIRKLSKRMKLPTHNKPAMACLASRIPYGSAITTERLKRIEKAEGFISDLGFSQLRVRDHDGLARIEIDLKQTRSLLQERIMRSISKYLKKIGYRYVCLDLVGYQTGSMNPKRRHVKP